MVEDSARYTLVGGSALSGGEVTQVEQQRVVQYHPRRSTSASLTGHRAETASSVQRLTHGYSNGRPRSRHIYRRMRSAPNTTATTLLDSRAMDRTLRRMADEIVELNDGTDDLVIVGIQRRGVQLADRIARLIEEREGVAPRRGALDITLYRDDLQTVGPRPVVGPTDIPWDMDGARVVIVDDVLYTGRTVRAALDELADFGRPARASRSPCSSIEADASCRSTPTSSASASTCDPINASTCSSTSSMVAMPSSSSPKKHRPRALRSIASGPRAGRARRTLRRDASARQGDLLGLEALSPEQIRLILDTAEPFKEISERAIKKVPALRGSTIVNLFFEPSTRTRVSFEFAEKRLSADTVNVAASGSRRLQG